MARTAWEPDKADVSFPLPRRPPAMFVMVTDILVYFSTFAFFNHSELRHAFCCRPDNMRLVSLSILIGYGTDFKSANQNVT